MLHWTWGTWTDPLIDFGRELYVPWQITCGKKLYVDIAWFNGPVSQYFNATLFHIFGVNLSTLIWADIAILGTTIFALYFIICEICNIFTATISTLSVLLLFSFNQYIGIANYNWITPYSHEITHGVSLCIISLSFFLIWNKRKEVFWLGLTGFTLGLTILTKVEITFASIGLLIAILLFPKRDKLFTNTTLVIFFLLPTIIASFFFDIDQITAMYTDIFNTSVTSLLFYKRMSGLNVPLQSIASITKQTVFYILIFAPITTLEITLKNKRRMAFLISCCYIILLYLMFRNEFIPFEFLKPLQLFLLILAIIFFIKKEYFILSFSLLSEILLLKVALNIHATGYSFALAVPGTVLFLSALLYWIPNWIREKGGDGRIFQFVILLFLSFVTVAHINLCNTWITSKTITISNRQGETLKNGDIRGLLVNETLHYLEKEAPKSLLVIPEGIMINYLARIPNNIPYVNFMPVEKILFGEDNWINAIQKYSPDIILYFPKDTREYGQGSFTTYASDFVNNINNDYVLKKYITAPNSSYKVSIITRRNN